MRTLIYYCQALDFPEKVLISVLWTLNSVIIEKPLKALHIFLSGHPHPCALSFCHAKLKAVTTVKQMYNAPLPPDLCIHSLYEEIRSAQIFNEIKVKLVCYLAYSSMHFNSYRFM